MKSFIDHIAEYLLDRFPLDMGSVCVVFPNRRAGLFLKKSLAQKINQPIWLPNLMTIEEFVFSLLGFNPVDPVRLRFELFQVYLNHEKDNPQPFSEFLSWADVLLRDFNDADMAMADIDELFGYLSESKAISLWNPDGSSLTPIQVRYLHFYGSLASYHKQLKSSLIAKKQLYQGFAFRELAEISSTDQLISSWEHVVFAGFNALTQAEEQIIKGFLKQGKASILWDTDEYYMSDPLQEAGQYLRKVKNVFNSDEMLWVGHNFQDVPKTIEIIGIPQNAGQAKLAGQMLNSLLKEGYDPANTTLILNDENLLKPLLNSLPPEIDEFNVTMGYPLKSTALFGLISNLFQMQESALRLNNEKQNPGSFFAKELIAFVDHPFIAGYIEKITGHRSAFSDWVILNNKSFVRVNEIDSLLAKAEDVKDVGVLKSVLTPWGDDLNIVISSIQGLFVLLSDYYSHKTLKSITEPNLELEYLHHFSIVLNHLGEMIQTYKYAEDLKSFRIIFTQLIQTLTVPFYGEPLNGIQIMGLLESRALDFENVIMLSVNEDHIPSGKSAQSFIPLDIKHSFGLSTFKERNSVFAYHFYRLLQRAKRVILFYNTEPGHLSVGEKSRFLLQLKNEIKVKSPGSIVSEKQYEVPLSEPEVNDLVYEKSDFVMMRLGQLAETGFSASSLNAFRRCSLQFYFRYIAGIKETEEVEETIEESTLGTIVHEVLENLYAPFKGKKIVLEEFKTVTANISDAIIDAYAANFKGGDIRYGKNLLMVKVAEMLTGNYLRIEIQTLEKLNDENKEFHIVDLEKEYTGTLELNVGSNVNLVRLIGLFDRIDRINGHTRIIDYKTGRVEEKELKVKNWNDLLHDEKLDKSFQLLFYLYLYSKNEPECSEAESFIISLRNPGIGPMGVSLPDGESFQAALLRFQSVLQELFTEMFDIGKGFSKTENSEVCLYCLYKTICNKGGRTREGSIS